MLTTIVPVLDGSRRPETLPAYLEHREGRSRIEDVARHLCLAEAHQTVFVALQDDLDHWALADVITRSSPDSRIVSLDHRPASQVFAVLMGLDRWQPDDELLVIDPLGTGNGDLEAFLVHARHTGADGVIATTTSHSPTASHIWEESGEVVQVVAGRPVSHQAVAGLHWFRRCQDFTEAAERAILRDPRLERAPDLEDVWNEMILAGSRITSRPLHRHRGQGHEEADDHRFAAEHGVRREG